MPGVGITLPAVVLPVQGLKVTQVVGAALGLGLDVVDLPAVLGPGITVVRIPHVMVALITAPDTRIVTVDLLALVPNLPLERIVRVAERVGAGHNLNSFTHCG